MLFPTLWLFGAGLATGLGVWWFSLDRRRGKEVRELAHTHRLHVDAVHEASVRALRYGFVEDFLFLVSKAHPRGKSGNGSILQPKGHKVIHEDTAFREKNHKLH